MAKTDILTGVEVQILVEDGPAKEYQDSVVTNNGPEGDITTNKYIKCRSDSCFKIQMAIDDSYPADKSLAFELFLDGRRVPAGVGLFDHRDPGDKFGLHCSWTEHCEEVGIKGLHKMLVKPFKFSKLDLVEDLDALRIAREKEATKELGEIRIEVVEVVAKIGTQATQELAEKSLKGRDVTHGIGLGEDAEVTEEKLRRKCTVHADAGWNKPLAIFTFRYRSRDALVMALIIDEYEDLTREELLQRLRDQERATRLQAPPIKAEGRVKSEKSVKRERDSNSFDGFSSRLNGGRCCSTEEAL